MFNIAPYNCTPKKSIEKCGMCLKSEQCKEGFCCPYMKKCIPEKSISCPHPIAECKPICKDSMDEQACTCKNKDFPLNWTKPTCECNAKLKYLITYDITNFCD